MKTSMMMLAAAVVGASAEAIENEWIVQLKPSSGLQRYKHLTKMNIAPDDVLNEYNIGEFQGYAVRASENTRLMIEESEDVIGVYPNTVMHATACKTVSSSSWGLGRLNAASSPTLSTYTYDDAKLGQGSVSYVVDTGVLLSHTQFEGRAVFGINTATGGNSDANGHGTHVAGTMGGKDAGIARETTLVAVKVLGDNGSGTTAGVIAGVDYVASNCRSRGATGACIANMSLGGGANTSLDNAVNAAHSAGVLMVVAAGNDNSDARNYSPARASQAFTVGSTDNRDSRSVFSNYGSNVNIFAPGSNIWSAWIGSNTATRTISGTSMASPHVAGVAAVLAAENPSWSPAQLKSSLVASAASGVISGTNTPAAQSGLLQNQC